MKFFFNKRPKPVPALIIPLPQQEAGMAVDHEQDEIAAVIALSIHMYINQVREYENSIITMQKVMKPYSPWSSKIYGLRPQLVHAVASRPLIKRIV